MSILFVDTAGWVAAADAADPLSNAVCHARDAWLEGGGTLVTTDYGIQRSAASMILA